MKRMNSIHSDEVEEVIALVFVAIADVFADFS